jgi:hypothetical protein
LDSFDAYLEANKPSKAPRMAFLIIRRVRSRLVWKIIYKNLRGNFFLIKNDRPACRRGRGEGNHNVIESPYQVLGFVRKGKYKIKRKKRTTKINQESLV